MKKIKFNQAGICPICGSEYITYGAGHLEETNFLYPCTCDDCGATFEENYSLNFSSMINTYDKNEERHYSNDEIFFLGMEDSND